MHMFFQSFLEQSCKDKTEVDQLHSATDNWVQLMEGEIGFVIRSVCHLQIRYDF